MTLSLSFQPFTAEKLPEPKVISVYLVILSEFLSCELVQSSPETKLFANTTSCSRDSKELQLYRHCEELLPFFFFFFSLSYFWHPRVTAPYWNSGWVSESGSCHKTCSVKTGSIGTSCRNGSSINAIVQWVKQIRKEKEIAAYDLEHQHDHAKTFLRMPYSSLVCSLCQSAKGCS